ncbi:uncharacterized protein JN550_005982 [Neoarthrinium moseri]|uniref:uncharacterized protein n=1 Tax=Neoarthrinium moseri TaxID=1658444 RepID=UPI001FDC1B54|nr:uncharacterized protein JN550_005982 [Neoarthrinium moseri]KAI1869352.1 hypothetical protein JN550_005982 [Neoarthrinium moseri]
MAGPIGAMLYQAYMKWFPIPLPAPDSFSGQTAVVTGGTSGLGLAAAVHLVNLGASEVIISSRNPSRAHDALEAIERATGGKSKGKMRVLDLDMEKYASVVAFAEEVKAIKEGKGGVDVLILNAGVAGVDHKLSDEGWEQNIQVNTLSTTLLALLLLPHLKAERPNRRTAAHLSIVGSMRFGDPDIKEWKSWQVGNKGEGEGVLEHLSRRENFPGPSVMYASTKLLVMYAFTELVELAKGTDGRPQVILNTMCPGIVKTDLPRNYKGKGAVFVAGIGVFYALFGKSAADGARAYLAAVTTEESEHGKFIQFYKSEKQLQALSNRVLTSEDGKRMQSQIWREITGELGRKVPKVRDFLVVSQVTAKR